MTFLILSNQTFEAEFLHRSKGRINMAVGQGSVNVEKFAWIIHCNPPFKDSTESVNHSRRTVLKVANGAVAHSFSLNTMFF